jgi:UDP-N-acetylglucosamine/UDP-N-acetyl-alpha-D-glucosaminouronate 4-epimerase
MKVLVTGAAGFIGSHLTQRLVALGHEVRALDNFATGRPENLAEVRKHVEFLEADLADPDVGRGAVRGVEVVFHEAALSSVPRSVAEPERTHRANVEATFHVLEACRVEGVRRVVYASSCSVYGDAEELPKHEAMPVRPRSPYAVHKHVGELYGGLYTELFGLEVVSLRYFNIFGPRQDPHGEYSAVIPKFIAMMLHDQRPTIFGDGKTSRDFTFVENAVDANLLAMDAPQAPGQSLNIGHGARVSLDELVEKLNSILGKDLAPVYLPERPGDVRHSLADIRLASELLGYRPRIGLEEGLARTVEAIRASETLAPDIAL